MKDEVWGMTESLRFTKEAIAGLIAEGTLMMLIPVVLLVLWKKKTHESIFPVVIGASTWYLFAILLKIVPVYLLLQADNPVAKTISGSVWLSYLIAGILAGVFEETGRFLAFRFVLKKREDRRTSITYGIGHGGFESFYIGFQMTSLAVLGILFNSGMGDMITAGADETTLPLLAAQLGPYADLSFAECLLGVFERLPAIAIHVSFSVLVFAAVRKKRFAFLYPAAIVLHAFVDFSIVFCRI